MTLDRKSPARRTTASAEGIGDAPAVKRLDVDTILEAGLAIASAPGATTVTVRQLGARLGADPTAVYRHFKNKDDLMRALLDRLIGIAIGRIASSPVDWTAYLREMSERTLDVFLEYPVIGAEASRLSSGGANELATIEGVLEALDSAGLVGEDRIRHYGVVSGFIVSFCTGIVRARQGGPTEALASSRWIDKLDVSAASHPRINESRDALLAITDREIYRSAINLLLDGIPRSENKR
jgi:AcrR family transcriptional regulator